MFSELSRIVEGACLFELYGKVEEFVGLSVEARMRDVFYGERCTISSIDGKSLDAEVKGFRNGRVVLLPYGDLTGVKPGSFVKRSRTTLDVQVGQGLLGRIVDGMGRPIDLGPEIFAEERRMLRGQSVPPLERSRIRSVLPTGVKALDSMLTLGKGQRLGIFAGAGVGKSSLLGMLLSGVEADITVIALIGERGREVKDFLEEALSDEQRERTVVVAATADDPALLRVNAAFTAMAICEYFRDQGKDVFLAVDSLTRFAMAQREVGLSVGEPPTAKGYTPSVFGLLPELIERAGTKEGAGSISAVYTLLVENEELEDPIAESARAILDGHIILSREVANEGRYPAIDFLGSISRLANRLQDDSQIALCRNLRALIKNYAEARDLVSLGAYHEGKNPNLDRSLVLVPRIYHLFEQSGKAEISRDDVYAEMARILDKK
ncbi:FliI/YscN family ATPase [Microbulbifer sp. SAOS-129_SWC]|uniref:FliI/YscN family ATPase n=1 Tax=Microbulbifer sp. SAOS-129_SWC TaxID=3145235 RepID=UPI0032174655